MSKEGKAGSSPHVTRFTDLVAWREGHDLVIGVFRETMRFPPICRALATQMQRAAISVTSNIAEGFGRQSIADKKHFYVIARGSTTELQNQLLIARDIGVCQPEVFQDLAERSILVHKLIIGLVKSIEKRRR